jgi:hypothetical protein
MKSWFAAAALVTICLAIVPDVSGQVVVSQARGPAGVIGGPAQISQAYVPPYSYYAAWPRPARIYVPSGPGAEFPFYGRAYGHPYDRWTWTYLGGGYDRNLARYYYPPVP